MGTKKIELPLTIKFASGNGDVVNLSIKNGELIAEYIKLQKTKVKHPFLYRHVWELDRHAWNLEPGGAYLIF